MTYPPLPPTPPPVPPRKNRANIGVLAVLGVAVTLFAGVLIGRVADSPATDEPRRSTSTPAKKAAPAEQPEDESPVYDTVDEDSFSIELRTTSRQCFGSAGCNVIVEPEVTYLGDSEDIDPEAVYEITYEIRGDESGPVLDTLELSDQTTINYSESMISTASSGVKVTVKITDVISR